MRWEIKFIISELLNGATSSVRVCLAEPHWGEICFEWRNRFNFSWRISLLSFLSVVGGWKKENFPISPTVTLHLAPSITLYVVFLSSPSTFSTFFHSTQPFDVVDEEKSDGAKREWKNSAYWFSQRDFLHRTTFQGLSHTHTRDQMGRWENVSLHENFLLLQYERACPSLDIVRPSRLESDVRRVERGLVCTRAISLNWIRNTESRFLHSESLLKFFAMWTSSVLTNLISSRSSTSSATSAGDSIKYSAISGEVKGQLRNVYLPLDLEETVSCFCRWVKRKRFLRVKMCFIDKTQVRLHIVK